MEPLIEPGFRVDLTEYFKEFGKLKEPALSLKVASIETQILAKWGWPPNNWTEKDEVSVLPAVFKIMWSIYVSAEAIEILATAKRFINEALQNLVGRAALLYLESKQQSKVWGDLINWNQFGAAGQSINALTLSLLTDSLDTKFILRTAN